MNYNQSLLLLGSPLLLILFFSTVSYPISGEFLSFEVEEYKVFGVAASKVVYILMFLSFVLWGRRALSNINIKYTAYALLVSVLFVLPDIFKANSYAFINAFIVNILSHFFVFFLYQNIKRFDDVLYIMAVYSLMSSLFALFLYFTGMELFSIYQPENYSRVIGWYGNPNFLSTTLGVGVICSFYLSYLKYNKYCKYIFLIILIAMLMSGSKSVIGNLFFIFVIVLTYKFACTIFNRRVALKGVLNFFIILCLFSVVLYYLFFIDEHLQSYFSGGTSKALTLTGRTDIWIYYINEFKSLSSFDNIIGKGRGYIMNETGLGVSAHSFYVRALLENGLLYLLLVVGVMLYCIFKSCYLFFKCKISVYGFIFVYSVYFLVRNVTTTEYYKFGPAVVVFLLCYIFLLSSDSRRKY